MSNNDGIETDILIVGAGLAGLTAAAEMAKLPQKVLVVDKGRGVGGRMASRRIGAATFDHGAQFMTARDPRFRAAVAKWLNAGIVMEWFRGTGTGEGHPRWRGAPAMTAIAKHLSGNCKTMLGTRLISLQREQSGWLAGLEKGGSIFARSVLLTPPVPQSLALLDAGNFGLPEALRTNLEALTYERCFAVMAVLNRPSRIPQPGCLKLKGNSIAWIADNQMKGVSKAPAITIHADPIFSLENWGNDRNAVGLKLLAAAAPWLGAEVKEFQVHGWRYAKPLQIYERPCAVISKSPPLIFAGDTFSAPRVEGAALSGLAAAALMKHHGDG